MAVAAADVKAQFPELAAIDDATITRWLAFAQIKHSVAVWGTKSDLGLVCLTAHLVELHRRRNAGATGPALMVQSRSVDDVSTTFFAPTVLTSLTDAALASTAYGQLYLDLRSSIFVDRVF